MPALKELKQANSKTLLDYYIQQYDAEKAKEWFKYVLSHKDQILEYTRFWEKYKPSPQAEQIAKERYLLKLSDGSQETWEMLARRVARTIVSAYSVYGSDDELVAYMNELEDVFFHIINSRVALPNTPTLVNAGAGVPEKLLYKEGPLMWSEYRQIYNSLDRRYSHG